MIILGENEERLLESSPKTSATTTTAAATATTPGGSSEVVVVVTAVGVAEEVNGDDELIMSPPRSPNRSSSSLSSGRGIVCDEKKINEMTSSLIDDYYWHRLDRLDTLVAKQLSDENDEDDHEEEDLREFFNMPLDETTFCCGPSGGGNADQTPPLPPPSLDETQNQLARRQAETNFKLMLLHLVGELMLDLYSDRFDDVHHHQSYSDLVSYARIPPPPTSTARQRKCHFKSIFKGKS